MHMPVVVAALGRKPDAVGPEHHLINDGEHHHVHEPRIGKYGCQERHAHEAGVTEDETELEYAILIVFDAHELRNDEHQQAYDRVEEHG